MNNRGVSLVEILITAVLIGFLGLSFAAIYITANRFLIQDSTIVLSQGDASFAVDHIRRQIMVANRVVKFTGVDAKVAFRYDPVFPGTPTDFSDDRWAGYRLDGDVLNFVADLGVPGTTDPTDVTGTAESPPVARGVVAPGGTVEGGTAPALFTLEGSSGTLLMIDLTVQKIAGKETRQTRLKSRVSPRGVSS